MYPGNDMKKTVPYLRNKSSFITDPYGTTTYSTLFSGSYYSTVFVLSFLFRHDIMYMKDYSCAPTDGKYYFSKLYSLVDGPPRDQRTFLLSYNYRGKTKDENRPICESSSLTVKSEPFTLRDDGSRRCERQTVRPTDPFH